MLLAAVLTSIGAGVTMPVMNIIFGMKALVILFLEFYTRLTYDRSDGGFLHRILQYRCHNNLRDVQERHQHLRVSNIFVVLPQKQLT